MQLDFGFGVCFAQKSCVMFFLKHKLDCSVVCCQSWVVKFQKLANAAEGQYCRLGV